jgi:glycosyltransferase involved in cell wall biosynthesis
MIREMSSAGLFALPRKDALFSRAGFATKLAEYLATGRPVVTSAVGDIGLYLRDGRDAFLAPAGAGFADKLREALADPVRASEIGQAGRETATRCFGVGEHGKRLAAFLDSLGSRTHKRR